MRYSIDKRADFLKDKEGKMRVEFQKPKDTSFTVLVIQHNGGEEFEDDIILEAIQTDCLWDASARVNSWNDHFVMEASEAEWLRQVEEFEAMEELYEESRMAELEKEIEEYNLNTTFEKREQITHCESDDCEGCGNSRETVGKQSQQIKLEI